tara:strand:- start:1072 stop:1749 length:678 start_codon:yes stop_codon:yes gene_type:complete
METIEENKVLVENEDNSGSESDSSLDSSDLNDLQNSLSTTFEKEKEIIIFPTIPVIEDKPLVIEDKPAIITPIKQKRGRPKKNKTESIKIIEKKIYMVQDDNGDYVEKKEKPLSARDLKKIEVEKQNIKTEIEIGKKLIRKKNGKLDNRSVKERTPAQIAHSIKLVELNRLRREKKLIDSKKELDNSIDNSVKKSMIKIITEPKKMLKDVVPDYKPPKPKFLNII